MITDRKATGYTNRGCFAVMGSITNAQKAQKVLSAAAIPTSLNKTEASSAHKGCVWSVTFACNQLQNVKSVLAYSGLRVKEWGGIE